MSNAAAKQAPRAAAGPRRHRREGDADPRHPAAAPVADAEGDARLRDRSSPRCSRRPDRGDDRLRSRQPGGAGGAGAAEAAPPAACLPDAQLDVAAWSNGRRSPSSSRRCAGSSSASSTRPIPRRSRGLARLYLRFGFGAEAEALLAGFAGGPARDRALLARPRARRRGRGRRRRTARWRRPRLPRAHGLWQALGGVAPVWRDAATFVSVQAAFPALPPDLRLLRRAAASSARLIDAGHPAEARVIYDTTVRPGERKDAALALVGARLAALDGHPLEAAQAMAALVEARRRRLGRGADRPGAAGARRSGWRSRTGP